MNNYYILVKYFYYNGTYGARKDGPMVHPFFGNRYEFGSVQEAKDFLKEEGISYQLTPQSFVREGRYTLFHGEYAEPQYHIRKMRKNQQHTGNN